MVIVQIRCSLLLFLITKLSLLSIIPTTKSDPTYLNTFCTNSSTSISNSTKHQANLNTVFRTLSSNANASNPSGFSTTSASEGTREAVYGLFMCRGDQNATGCHDCVTTATTSDLPKRCPKGSQAIIYYDECMVRYSNESFFGVMDQSPRLMLRNTQNINGDQDSFGDLMFSSMNSLTAQAAKGDKFGRKFGVNQTKFNSQYTLYELVQCTQDLSPNDCDQCLRIAIGQLNVSQGARTIVPSCNARYEIYRFYDESFLSAPPPSPETTSNGNGSSPSSINSASGKKKISASVIAAIVVPAALLSVAILAIGICLIKRKAKYDVVATENGQDFSTAESLQFDLATLQSATNNFSNERKLGEGGFGGVYKGTLANGQEIAVKRLSKTSGQGAREFKNEVLVVAKLQHRNLVRLMGFCLAGEEKLLVYEYVANKSLDYFLFDPERQQQLDWGKRYKIIGGIARGMLYLHQDSRLRIIHRDLKASNVLLDVDMNPKIADFGLARIVGVDQSQGSTSRVVGTYGYMSPEYAMHGQFSVKSDVYSFGVLVLEIISGKRNTDFYESGYAEDLLSYAWKQWRDGNLLEFVDPTLRDSCSSNEVMRCIHLGLLCVQESAEERPTMATAALMLDSYSVTLPVPEQPAFFIKSKVESNFSRDTGSDQSTTKSIPMSINDVTVTDIDPR